MQNFLHTFYKKLADSFCKISHIFHYYNAASKKVYPCRLLDGYSFSDDGSIELTIKQFGQGSLITIKAHALFENEHLMSSLNPYDIAKVSFIAFGEYFCKSSDENKEVVFKKFLSKAQGKNRSDNQS